MPAITNVNELQAMEADLDGEYWLANDINAAATAGWNGGAGFVPIGQGAPYFTGSFDGKGYTISDLFINRPAEDYIGLFGCVHTAGGGVNIIDVTLADVDITGDDKVGALLGHIYGDLASEITDVIVSGTVDGDDYVGGLIGQEYTISGLTVSGCHTSGTVTNLDDFVGGLIGATYFADISGCSSSATVTGVNMYIGGLIGMFWGTGTLAESYATGDVSAPALSKWVGGLIGRVKEVGSITDCYARGAVTGDDCVGGFTGELSSGSIDNSFSTGEVTGNTNVGGFCGVNGDTITDCFWDTQTSGQAASDGGTGQTTSEMTTRSTFTGAGWDFIIIWGINGITNDGYPFHWAMPPEDLPDAPRETVLVEDKITLESIRNVEMAAMGRFSINEQGEASYKSRYARNP